MKTIYLKTIFLCLLFIGIEFGDVYGSNKTSLALNDSIPVFVLSNLNESNHSIKGIYLVPSKKINELKSFSNVETKFTKYTYLKSSYSDEITLNYLKISMERYNSIYYVIENNKHLSPLYYVAEDEMEDWLFTISASSLNNEMVEKTNVSKWAVKKPNFSAKQRTGGLWMYNKDSAQFIGAALLSPLMKGNIWGFNYFVEPLIYLYQYEDELGYQKSNLNFYSQPQKLVNVNISQLYLSNQLKHFELTYGLIRYNFGVADYVNPVDKMNALNYNLFIVDDKIQKLPSLSVDIKYFHADNFEFELGISPFQYRSIPPAFSWLGKQMRELYKTSLLFSFTVKNDYKFYDALNSAENFIRAKYKSSSGDFNFYWLNTHFHEPVFKMIYPDPFFPLPQSVKYEYPRYQLYGFDYQQAIGEYTIRSEFAYSSKSFQSVSLSTDSDKDLDNVFISPDITGVVGIDKTYAKGLYVNAQFYGNYIVNYVKDSLNRRAEIDSQFILSARKKLFKERIEIEANHIYDLAFNDAIFHAKIKFELINNLTVCLGYRNYYLAKKDANAETYGIFSQFNKNDHIYFNATMFF